MFRPGFLFIIVVLLLHTTCIPAQQNSSGWASEWGRQKTSGGKAGPLSSDLDRALAAGDMVALEQVTQKWVSREPNNPFIPVLQAHILFFKKKYPEAIATINRSVDSPLLSTSTKAEIQGLRGRFYERTGHPREALRDFKYAAAILKTASAYNSLAWALATCPDASLRSGKQAIAHANKALLLPGGKHPQIMDTMAASQAEAGDFASAIKWETQAIAGTVLPKTKGEMAERLALFQKKLPYREPSQI